MENFGSVALSSGSSVASFGSCPVFEMTMRRRSPVAETERGGGPLFAGCPGDI